jgi:hypothetical protein
MAIQTLSSKANVEAVLKTTFRPSITPITTISNRTTMGGPKPEATPPIAAAKPAMTSAPNSPAQTGSVGRGTVLQLVLFDRTVAVASLGGTTVPDHGVGPPLRLPKRTCCSARFAEGEGAAGILSGAGNPWEQPATGKCLRQANSHVTTTSKT